MSEQKVDKTIEEKSDLIIELPRRIEHNFPSI